MPSSTAVRGEVLVTGKFHIERSGIALLILLPAVYLFYLSNPPWDTPGATTAYYSVLAFLCVTITASAANRIRIDPSPSNNVLFACTGYASIVFSGAAIVFVLLGESAVIHSETSGVFLNLVALATTGILMFLYSILDRVIKKENSIWESRRTPLGIIALFSLVFLAMMVVARLPLDDSVFLIAGYTAGAVAILAYASAAVLTFRGRILSTTNDSVRMAISFVLLAAASLNHILILPSPSSQWVVSICLMALGFVIANMSVSYTFLLDIGVSDNFAYALAIATSVMAVAPFILAHLTMMLVGSVAISDIGATTLIHISASVLAALSAYALYMKSREYPSSGVYAIVFLLMFWAVSEIAIVFSHLLPGYGFETETRVPYIAGSIVSCLMLVVAIRRVLDPTKTITGPIPRLYLLGLIGAPFLLLFGEFVRQYVFLGLLGMTQTIVGSAMMLGLSYISLYALLTYILLLTSASGGKWLFYSVGPALASVWIVVVILKANFAYATAGWWIAEAIMFFMTIVPSFALLRMYLTESGELEKVGPVASAYSRMISEDILSHQKSAIDRLSEMTMDTRTDELRLDSLAQILNEVSRANDLAKYLQVLASGNRFREEDLEATDVMYSITTAMNRSNISESVRKFKDDAQGPGAKLVHANSLLVDLFYYLFEGISKRIGTIEMLGVGIREREKHPVSDIEVTFDLLVKAEKIDQGLSLTRRYFERYSPDVMEFAYSRRLAELFEGSVDWRTEIASSQNLLITVEVALPSV